MSRYRIRHVVFLLTLLLLLVVWWLGWRSLPRLETLVHIDPQDLGSRDPDVGCRFPLLHPFDPSILSYLAPPPNIRCKSQVGELTLLDEARVVRRNKTALVEAGYDEEGSGLACSVQPVLWEDDFHVKYGTASELTGDGVSLEALGSDVAYVACRGRLGWVVYEAFHVAVVPAPGVRQFTPDSAELGVVVIGLDSLSRLNWLRQLPKTAATFRKLGGITMFGFNKVGENTFPNLMPVLTGHPAPPPPYNSFLGWPLVWEEVERAGGATGYLEDVPEFNMFNYLAEGLSRPPTTHYGRPLWLAVEGTTLRRRSSPYCLGPLLTHRIHLTYLASFLRAYHDRPHFLFTLYNELTHNHVNTAGVLDGDLSALLEKSAEGGLLNRSLVVVMGDHGNRIDPLRATRVGQVEDRMPLVGLLIPDWVDRVRPGWRQAVQLNSRRLTSSYDLYHTFLDVIATLEPGPPPRSPTSHPRPPHFAGSPKAGQSLLRPVPVSRTCADAGVPAWLCVCGAETGSLDTASRLVVRAAAAVLRHINEQLLSGLASCERLRLTHVRRASRTSGPPALLQVQVKVEPGSGLLEASLTDDEALLVQDVVRVNAYGTQAHCLPDHLRAQVPLLKAICYCK